MVHTWYRFHSTIVNRKDKCCKMFLKGQNSISSSIYIIKLKFRVYLNILCCVVWWGVAGVWPFKTISPPALWKYVTWCQKALFFKTAFIGSFQYCFCRSILSVAITFAETTLWEHGDITKKQSWGNKYVQSNDQTGFKHISRVVKFSWKLPNCPFPNFDPVYILQLLAFFFFFTTCWIVSPKIS